MIQGYYLGQLLGDLDVLDQGVHVTGLLLQQLIEHIRVVLALLAVQVNAQSLHGVQDHGVDGVGVDDGLEHDPLLQAIVCLVDDPHLLQESGLARLSSSEKTQINLIYKSFNDTVLLLLSTI